MQPESIARRLAATAVLLACLTASGWAGRFAGHTVTEAPAYVELFAPPSHARAYHTYVSPLGPDELLRTLLEEPALVSAGTPGAAIVRTPGAWEPRREGPLDAFGRSGPYNRSRLARLYGSRAVTVARGARATNGRIAESWTLISPYPDPTLTRLEPGTLVVIVSVP